MPNLPIRGLGSVGVVTDVDPFNLPINGYTRAKNVRFHEGKVTHGPIYRNITSDIVSNTVFACGVSNIGGYDTVLLVDDTFTVREYGNGTTTQRLAGSGDASTLTITHTVLADVQYLNRSDRAPVARLPGNTDFVALDNWPNDALTKKFTTTSLRSFGDFLLALGTKETVANAASSFPNRIRFSDLALANSVPSSWDDADATKSAGFTDLVQMTTPIVDGATIGSNFLIYSSDQVWLMEFIGGTFIFSFRKLFDDAGVISQNCIVEVEGQHYVFDRNDIYRTDGVTRESICEGRVRDYIFAGLDMSKDSVCFVQHIPTLEEIYFCYHSGDDMALNDEADYANRAAVYNYRDNTWSFQDLPNVSAGGTSNFDTTETYSTITTAYNVTGGTYQSQESQYNVHPFFVTRDGGSIDESRIVGLDFIDNGTITEEINSSFSQSAYLERVGIDLDEQGVELSGYKVISRMYPQIATVNTDGNFDFTFGAADNPNATPNYGTASTFDAAVDYKIDSRMSGRYLSYKVSTPSLKDFAFSGMDLDVTVTGRR